MQRRNLTWLGSLNTSTSSSVASSHLDTSRGPALGSGPRTTTVSGEARAGVSWMGERRYRYVLSKEEAEWSWQDRQLVRCP
jgi:hypothetical protein